MPPIKMCIRDSSNAKHQLAALLFRGRFYNAVVHFFKQKTAYEILRSDWSSDVCSSDLKVTSVHIFSALE